MLFEFNTTQLFLLGLIFVWTGFVRSGLGFGGAALGLPLMLFIHNQPVFWLPIIGIHLLFFSTLTLRTRFHNVDWAYLKKSLVFIIPATLIGVFGLLNLPTHWLLVFIYSITLIYAFLWLFDVSLHSNKNWVDKLLLFTGGYVAGTSLTGAPLMVAVYMRNIAAEQLRNTLFVLWFVLVSIKMSTFATLGIDLQFLPALMLLPIASIGHVIGLKTHDLILKHDGLFKKFTGGILAVISSTGLYYQVAAW